MKFKSPKHQETFEVEQIGDCEPMRAEVWTTADGEWCGTLGLPNPDAPQFVYRAPSREALLLELAKDCYEQAQMIANLGAVLKSAAEWPKRGG